MKNLTSRAKKSSEYLYEQTASLVCIEWIFCIHPVEFYYIEHSPIHRQAIGLHIFPNDLTPEFLQARCTYRFYCGTWRKLVVVYIVFVIVTPASVVLKPSLNRSNSQSNPQPTRPRKATSKALDKRRNSPCNCSSSIVAS